MRKVLAAMAWTAGAAAVVVFLAALAWPVHDRDLAGSYCGRVVLGRTVEPQDEGGCTDELRWARGRAMFVMLVLVGPLLGVSAAAAVTRRALDS